MVVCTYRLHWRIEGKVRSREIVCWWRFGDWYRHSPSYFYGVSVEITPLHLGSGFLCGTSFHEAHEATVCSSLFFVFWTRPLYFYAGNGTKFTKFLPQKLLRHLMCVSVASLVGSTCGAKLATNRLVEVGSPVSSTISLVSAGSSFLGTFLILCSISCFLLCQVGN